MCQLVICEFFVISYLITNQKYWAAFFSLQLVYDDAEGRDHGSHILANATPNKCL